MTASSSPDDLPYRACAGMMVLNNQNKVFVARRIDTVSEHWQMPQGGIDKGETPLDAAFRELEEEIGTRNVSHIHGLDEWLNYDLPKDLIGKIWKGKYRGQKQKWFLFRFLGEDHEINIETDHPEFSEWRWAGVDELPGLIVPFKRDIYETIIRKLRPYF
ncbi:MAG: RNA pyrophosphohydrolase [Sneathiella sp.]|nr:MAG: RNA pyrophosphohydrolase [Sneathiella sp.]